MAAPADKAAENGRITLDQEAGSAPVALEELKNLNYELLLVALSLLSVVNLFLVWLIRDATADDVIAVINIPLTLIFFVDFLIRLRTAESKRRYFFRQFGWVDLLAGLPWPVLNILRLSRAIRTSRLLGAVGVRGLLREIRANRADAALAVIAFCIVLVLEFGAIAVVFAERPSRDANIKTASDAIWWVYVSITTVGYGDRYPVTNWGRFVGVIVLMTGVGLFGVLTGYLANAFLAPGKKKEGAAPPAAPDTQAMLAEIKGLLAEQQKEKAELRALVAELKERTPHT